MLFSPVLLVGAGSILTLAVFDKLADDYGFSALGTILKLALPIAAIIAACCFLESNAVMWLLR